MVDVRIFSDEVSHVYRITHQYVGQDLPAVLFDHHSTVAAARSPKIFFPCVKLEIPAVFGTRR